VKGFATDFPTKAQLAIETVFCTPHLGAGTPEADENCAVMAQRRSSIIWRTATLRIP
jgi:D-3-phosphoglycerate dehydrogenase